MFCILIDLHYLCRKFSKMNNMIEQFEEQLHRDLHLFLLSMKEVDERLPECPDVEGKWETIAKARRKLSTAM